MPAAAATEAPPDAWEAAGRQILLGSPAFDRRLDPASPAPLAVGLSGGSDSTALLLAAKAWADRAGRPVLALTVDHGLRPESGAWTAACGALAARLGVRFQALAWSGPKPATGLPAAARAARHRLLALAARAAGARVLLLGHTADDRREAAHMRRGGSSVGSPREWAPSPIWPQGRGLFLLRPLLDQSRAGLRAILQGAQLDWIEDPANDDQAYARARARRALRAVETEPDLTPAEAPIPTDAFMVDRFGAVRMDRDALRQLAPEAAAWLLAAACVCAGGGDRLPRRGRVQALLARLSEPGPVVATLAGARIEAGAEVLVCRDLGRVGAAPPGVDGVWDGRFETALAAELKPLRGLASRLAPEEARRLHRLPAAVRPALPARRHGHGYVTCPLLAERPEAAARCLVGSRLAAAVGLIGSEAQAARAANGEDGVGALS